MKKEEEKNRRTKDEEEKIKKRKTESEKWFWKEQLRGNIIGKRVG